MHEHCAHTGGLPVVEAQEGNAMAPVTDTQTEKEVEG